jgi:hypothetical protein
VGDGLSSETAPCDVGGSGEQRRHAENFIILDVYRKVLEVVEEGRAEVGGRKHLDGFRRYAELIDAVERLLEDTRSLAHWRTIL